MDLTQLPLRVSIGAFFLNAGVGKLHADPASAEFYYKGAQTAYPGMFDTMTPSSFTKFLAYSELAVGAALVAPMVPATVAGAALTGFGASLVRLYLKTPGMTEPDGIRPTSAGIAMAKDTWLVGAGLTLLSQGLRSRSKSKAAAIARA